MKYSVWDNPYYPPGPTQINHTLDMCRSGDLNGVKSSFGDGFSVAENSALLRTASLYGHLDIVDYLIKNGVSSDDDKALCCALIHGHLNITKYLIDDGADPRKKKSKALWVASRNGHIDSVKFLVGCGANVNAYRCAPLRFSFGNGHFGVAIHLIENGSHYGILDWGKYGFVNVRSRKDAINNLKIMSIWVC